VLFDGLQPLLDEIEPGRRRNLTGGTNHEK